VISIKAGHSPRATVAALCCTALFLYAVYLGALGVLLPAIGASFGLGSAAEGRFFPANFLGFIAGVLLCGSLSDRLGRKAVLLGGVAAYALGLALFSRSGTFAVALLATAFVGAGSGAMETVASALAADLFPERRAFLINALQVAFGVGAGFGPALAHRLLTTGTDWRALPLALAAANVLLFLALALQPVADTRHEREALDLNALRALLSQPVFLALCLAQALYVGAEVGFASWMPTYFLDRLPGGAAWAGTVVTVFWIGMTLGRIATGLLVTRLPLLRLSLFLALGGTVGAALAPVWTSPGATLAFVAVTGLCFSGIFGLILAEAGERYPRFAGTTFGAVVAAGGIGGAALPWAVGALAATGAGWRGALMLIPLVTTVLSVLLSLISRLERRRERESRH
jgi:FHS family glucose/mannose:H+ symporter-like MFS transporter